MTIAQKLFLENQKIELRPYQAEACRSTYHAIREMGYSRVLIAMATGMGKTIVFSYLPHYLGWHKRVLVLAHRGELLEQAAEKLRALNPGSTVAIEKADQYAGDAQFVVASVQSLKNDRLKRINKDEFSGVIVDEAHHSTAPSYTSIFEHMGCFSGSTPLVGVTATPKRSDDIGLGNVFEHIAFEIDINTGIEQNWLAPIVGKRILTNTDLSHVKTVAGDYVAKQLAAEIDNPVRNRIIVDSYLEHASGRKAIAFCADVAHGGNLKDAFLDAGIRAETITGKTPKDTRKEIIDKYKRGEYEVLTNCGVLTEGFDDPSSFCGLMARPTQSGLLYTQMIGRLTRKHETKEHALVLDFCDNSTRHTLRSVSSLMGLPPKMDTEGKSISECKQEIEAVQTEMPWLDLDLLERISDLPLLAESIDFFHSKAPRDIDKITKYSWMKDLDGRYRLFLPPNDGKKIMLIVEKDRLDKWQCYKKHDRQKTLINEFATVEGAIRFCDRWVDQESSESKKVIDLKAPWRKKPASDSQKNLLKKLGVKFPAGLNMGQASSIISHKLGNKSGKKRKQK